MFVHVNKRNEIKEVGRNTNPSLACLEINDNEIDNPFLHWNVEKICCYKVKVENGVVTEYTPYIDTKIANHFDKLGKADEKISNDILDTQIALTETFEKALSTEADITDIQLALVELYEMIVGGNE